MIIAIVVLSVVLLLVSAYALMWRMIAIRNMQALQEVRILVDRETEKRIEWLVTLKKEFGEVFTAIASSTKLLRVFPFYRKIKKFADCPSTRYTVGKKPELKLYDRIMKAEVWK